MAEAAERRRVVRWERQPPADPALSGLDILRAMADGRRPRSPVFSLIDLHVVAVEPGRVRARLTPAEYHYNPIGSVHGGIIATVLDTVLACAVFSTLPPGRGCVTLEIKVNYLRAVTDAVGPVFGEGVAVHTGRQVGVAEAKIVDAAGRPYATASTTMLVFERAAAPAGEGDESREHVVSWADPKSGARAGAGMAGLDYLRGMAAAALPRAPVAALLGLALGPIDPGSVTMTLPPGGHLNNPDGTMHGGMIATLLDSVMGCAVHSTLPVGRGYTTLELKVNYIRGITAASGPITGVGSLVHGGRQVAVADGRATDAAGRVCATASTTCLVFDQPARRQGQQQGPS